MTKFTNVHIEQPRPEMPDTWFVDGDIMGKTHTLAMFPMFLLQKETVLANAALFIAAVNGEFTEEQIHNSDTVTKKKLALLRDLNAALAKITQQSVQRNEENLAEIGRLHGVIDFHCRNRPTAGEWMALKELRNQHGAIMAMTPERVRLIDNFLERFAPPSPGMPAPKPITS